MSVLCVDIGGSIIKVGLFDGAAPIEIDELPNTGQITDLDMIVRDVHRLAARHAKGSSSNRTPLKGIGIAVPGVVDQPRGALVAAHDKCGYAIGKDLASWATEQLHAPAIVENDARAALWGESQFGCAVGERDAVLMVLGTGIGTAAMMGGHLLRGAHDHAAILGGHVTVAFEGPACNCSNIGCAEAIASTWALERTLRRHPKFSASSLWRDRTRRGHIGIEDLIGSSETDEVSRDTLTLFIRAWGSAVVGLCHAYDPTVVVISGGVMRSASVILPALTAYVDEHLWSSSHRPRFVTPRSPEHSVLLGLSALAEHAVPERTNR